MYPYIIQGSNISIFIDGKLHQFGSDHVSYNAIIEAIKAGDQDKVKTLVDAKQAILAFSKGSITIEGDVVRWRGTEMHGALSARMVSMFREGFDINPLVAFMENLLSNPSKQAVDEMYSFLEACDLPITPDGHFLAFKKVNGDYFDVHSRTVCNKPAAKMSRMEQVKYSIPQIGGKKNEVSVVIVNGFTTVSMPRNMVDDKRDNTCSEGLHFCSREYLKSFGGERIVVLKINPRDVVSIPADYNNSKGRCSVYQIVDELVVEPEQAFTKAVQDNANGGTAIPQMNASISQAFAPAAKTGSSDFFRGYSTGYAESEYDSCPGTNYFESQAYREGYLKGWDDAADGLAPRYKYVS